MGLDIIGKRHSNSNSVGSIGYFRFIWKLTYDIIGKSKLWSGKNRRRNKVLRTSKISSALKIVQPHHRLNYHKKVKAFVYRVPHNFTTYQLVSFALRMPSSSKGIKQHHRRYYHQFFVARMKSFLYRCQHPSHRHSKRTLFASYHQLV